MGWMAWTWPTAVFFAAIAVALVVLTLLERRLPSTPRRGWLPLATSRGDRFFMALLLAAVLHALWLALSDASVLYASGLALLLGAALMRWG